LTRKVDRALSVLSESVDSSIQGGYIGIVEPFTEMPTMTTATAYTFLVDALPEDHDWITVWEGAAKILCEAEDGREYYESGESSVSIRRETEDGRVEISISIPNNADLPADLNEAITEKFGVDMDYPNWGGAAGEEGQFCSYYLA
jgi:hypothetical protein